MFGLIVFGLMGIYLLLLISATVWAYRRAAKRGLPRGQRWLWAAGVFLVVYLPVFWDWLPTVAAHRYYCEQEAGFWIHKTVEQWKVENPGVMETLVAYKDGRSANGAYILNQRFNWALKEEHFFPLNYMIRKEQQVVDSKTGEILARYVDFSTSQIRRQAGWSGWKFWLDSEHCSGGAYNQDALRNFRNNFAGAGK